MDEDVDLFAELLNEPEVKPKKPKKQPKPKKADAPEHTGPLGVLSQSRICSYCRSINPDTTRRAMYSVNGEPMCAPHAMYVLSCICVDNNYPVTIITTGIDLARQSNWTVPINQAQDEA
jgi:hypothetical protein